MSQSLRESVLHDNVVYGAEHVTIRQCRDGLVHYVVYTKEVKGRGEPGIWLRWCDVNDDFVSVATLPLPSAALNCVACVAKGFREAALVEFPPR